MSWFSRLPVPPEIKPAMTQLTLDRFRMFMPVAIAGIVIALLVSVPAGVPVPSSVLASNGIVIGAALVLFAALRSGKVPGRHAHLVGACVWMLAPANTLASYFVT